jgi:ketosteroid isomerase-like protein
MSENEHVDVAAVKKQLARVFDAWFQSVDTRDASFVDRSMADDFRYIDYTGRVFGVGEYVKLYSMIQPGANSVHEIETFDVCVVGHGGAFVTGTYHVDVEFIDGSCVEGRLRFVSVWERHRDTWKARFHQTVKLPSIAAGNS